MSTRAIEHKWHSAPELVRAFIEARSHYEQLALEVAYILRKKLDARGIQYSTVTHRAKTLSSFLEKVDRKGYHNPMEETADLAAARVVYLYRGDQVEIEKTIEAEFEIREKVDKLAEGDPSRFGYAALHYIVSLGKESSGARYDDLRGRVCELQVRSVLQDAWAIVDHHLRYKQEAAVPEPLKRRLSGLAGTLELADSEFDQIRTAREEYLKKLRSHSARDEAILEEGVNLDSLREFIATRFPEMAPAASEEHLGHVAARLNDLGLETVAAVGEILSRTASARDAVREELKPVYGVSEIVLAVAFENPDYRSIAFPPEKAALVEKNRNLVQQG